MQVKVSAETYGFPPSAAALAGMPMTAGFVGRWLLWAAALEAGALREDERINLGDGRLDRDFFDLVLFGKQAIEFSGCHGLGWLEAIFGLFDKAFFYRIVF